MSAEPFRFYTRLNLVELLGRRACTAVELLDGIRQVPGASIYYHTHRFLQQHLYLSPEPPNDFAFWTATALGLDDLSEKLASVDTVRFRKIKDLQSCFASILEGYLAGKKGRPVRCQDGEEFHFMSCRTFILPTPYRAADLREFADVLERITVDSLYFHIFEARLRLERGANDFEAWFDGIGEPELAREVANLDPYTLTLEGLRRKIVRMVRDHVQH